MSKYTEFINTKVGYESLSNVKWSIESLKLKDFVSKNKLPQIVCVDEGHYASDGNEKIWSGQKLKLHSVKNELTALCYNVHNLPHKIPLHCQEPVEFFIREKPTHCASVIDIAKLNPLPNYVITQSQIFISIGDQKKGLRIRENEKLRIMFRTEQTTSQPKDYLTFRNETGDMFELPFNCQAGFHPIYKKETHLLNQILPNRAASFERPVYFKFVNPQFCYYQLGVLKCKEVKTRTVVVASSMQKSSKYDFSIPIESGITVRVAEGTKKSYNEYEIQTKNYIVKENENEMKKSCIIEMVRKFPPRQENSEQFSSPLDQKTKPQNRSYSVPTPKPRKEQDRSKCSSNSEDIYTELILSSLDENEYAVPMFTDVPLPLTETQKPTQSDKLTPIKQNSAIESHKARDPPPVMTKPKPSISNLNNSTPENISARESHKSRDPPPVMTKPKHSLSDHNSSTQENPTSAKDISAKKLDDVKTKDSSPLTTQAAIEPSDHSTPTLVKNMSVAELCNELKKLKLKKDVEIFKEHLIDGQLLCKLTENDLKEMEFSSLEIRKIVSFREGWLPKIS
ncbi:uncharacterized protein LOC130614604 [Hydractinia symbiolongicarpus]|uniref:uncharacterized protein LOC130614604 n=1 Tax=Hydractinia symbiolongicarpus TaxID=13093 RepID=UPI0025512783|nr:uncharacterized protein LOC130614604 [Hydractinia symbiolongicarpus]